MLTPLAMQMLGGKAIRPAGWLKRQLLLQANGLAGNLDKVWPDVRDSRWIGGDQEGWERVPYWLDGFIPLAYLLEDKDLQERAKKYVDGILTRQCEDGWICPCTLEERPNYDVWAALLITKVLAQYADYSGDERIEGALYRCYAHLNHHLDRHTLQNWGAARWYEGLIGLSWLYERRPEEWMRDLADKLHFQGFDFDAVFQRFIATPPERRWTLQTHVVNLAMCLKQEALYARFSQKPCGDFAHRALEMLMTHHGQANGLFSGDECLSGTSPVQGTELCSVVEAMYSYEQLLSLTGEPCWGDQLERLAFNALPATISTDMWSHQYDQQVNQIRCQRLPDDHVVFGTNGPESHRFGLEPNFGCCTANMGQGWPKLTASAVMKKEDGLAVCALVPVEAHTGIQGAAVTLCVEGDYPFRDTLTVKIKVSQPVRFPLFIRIPGYAAQAQIDGQAVPTGGFARIDRLWEAESQLQVSFRFEQQWVVRPSTMRCLWRGGLLFSLPIQEKWVKCESPEAQPPRIYPYCDHDVLPESEWAYAFGAETGEEVWHDVAAAPFDGSAPAMEIRMPMVPICWPEENGVATPIPQSAAPCGEPVLRSLVPYGTARLRMTEMPLAGDADQN